MSDIKYGWIKWKGHRLQWFIYILGLGFITGLLSLIFQLVINVDNRDAVWKEKDTEYITLASSKTNGDIKFIQGYPIKALMKDPLVKNTSSLLFTSKEVRFENQTVNANILFYDGNFTSVLKLPSNIPQNVYELNGVIVNKEFAKNSEVISLNNTDYKINFFLSKDYEYLSGMRIDILMPIHMYDQFNPFIKSDNNAETIRLGMPIYFGIGVVEKSLNLDTLKNKFNELLNNFSTSEIVQLDTKFVAYVSRGIQLKPKEKEFIDRQILVLIILFVCCFFIFVSNYFTLMEFHALDRAKEFKLKRNLGATTKHLILASIREQIPFIVISLISAIIFSLGIFTIYANSTVFEQYFTLKITFNWEMWILSYVFLSILFLILSLKIIFLPTSKVGLPTEKSNSFDKHSTKAHTKLTVLQISFAIVALSISSSLIFEQSVSLKSGSTNLETFVYEIINPQNENLTSFIRLISDEESQVGISASPLFKSNEPSMKWRIQDTNMTSTEVFPAFINKNLFTNLITNYKDNSHLNDNEIAVNQTMAKLISQKSKSNNIIGTLLSLDLMFTERSVRVVKVVNDLPFQGVSAKNEPYIYLPMSSLELFFLNPTSPTFYCIEKNDCLSVLSKLDGNYKNVGYLFKSNVASKLNSLNIGGDLIFAISLLVSTLISIILFVGFYYQEKNTINSKLFSLGLKMSLGANYGSLYKEELAKKSTVIFLSILASTFLIYLLLYLSNIKVDFILPAILLTIIFISSTIILIHLKLFHNILKITPYFLMSK